jgi:hypothetical protein
MAAVSLPKCLTPENDALIFPLLFLKCQRAAHGLDVILAVDTGPVAPRNSVASSTVKGVSDHATTISPRTVWVPVVTPIAIITGIAVVTGIAKKETKRLGPRSAGYF